MTINFVANPAADATNFSELFVDDAQTATWYRLWVGNEEGTSGNFVDTSDFNDEARGWIAAEDLDQLLVDYAQADDDVLWVQEYNAADGKSDWVFGQVDFDAIDAIDRAETMPSGMPLSQMFEDLNVSEGTRYQIWIGDDRGTEGAYLDTPDGKGWLDADDLDSYFFTAEAFKGDETLFDNFGQAGYNEIWVKTEADGQNYGWEHWNVEAVSNTTLTGIDLGGDTVGLAVNTDGGNDTLVGQDGGTVIDADAFGDNTGAEVLRITGDADIRIDLTDPTDQVEELDLNGDGVIAMDGVENDLSGAGIMTVSGFTVFDLYARNPKNWTDLTTNFFGDLEFDGTGFQGDGVNTDGNIVLSGLGNDDIFGGIGNDFIAGGGGADDLWGGRNADFFFVELSVLDITDGNLLDIDGGSTWDDDPSQDSDWVLGEFSDDDEPVTVNLGDSIFTRAGAGADILDIENFDASGNLYGFLNDLDVVIGGAAEYKSEHAADGTENYGLGSTAQMNIDGTDGDNIIIAGYDNDTIEGEGGDDILLGGNMQFLTENQNNPNILEIPNDGRDTIFGDAGDDDILFEVDGGVIEGGAQINVDDANIDTLWLTDYSLGAASNTLEDLTGEDNTLRFDLAVGKVGGLDNFSGYGGADEDTDDGNYTADQSNYLDDSDRVQVQDMENIIATGLGNIDYDVDGGNELIDDPADHNFTDRMNFMGIEEDLHLRGTAGDNILYANTGDDVLEGRTGDDSLSGGLGNDDFVFFLGGNGDAVPDGDGDDLDIIHRQQDENEDNFWDQDADGELLYTQDFGNSQTTFSNSTLNLILQDLGDSFVQLQRIPLVGFGFTLTDQVTGETTSFDFTVPGLGAGVDTYDEFFDKLKDFFQSDEGAALGLDVLDLSKGDDIADSTSPEWGIITITDTLGREFSAGPYNWENAIQPSEGTINWDMEPNPPVELLSEDRIIFAAYEDRADGELVDDDGFVNEVGDAVTLGGDAYAEDLVVRFDSDDNGTTILAEDQQWIIDFENLAEEDTVTISVNGTAFTLQVGVAADGTAVVDDYDNVTQDFTNFLNRLVALINAGADNDTLAGSLVAARVGNGIVLTQDNYNGGQVVFMDEPIVTLGNASGGEPASFEITNAADSEITLFEFDGRNNELNVDNVLFLGGSGMNDGEVTDASNSRSIFETALDAGGLLEGSDALVVDSMTDADTVATDFALHGDDLLVTGMGDDEVYGYTGDDTFFGSEGTDTIDGGKDIYVVQELVDGEIVETWEVMNEYDAAQRRDDENIEDVTLIEQDRANGPQIGYNDTLVFSTNDFDGTRFTVTVDDDLQQMNGGAGTVGVDEGDDGTIDHLTTFTEMEAIRTLAGDGTHAGQGHDTLDIQALSDAVAASAVNDPDAAVIYNMTSDLGFVQINADLDNDGEIDDDNNIDGPDENDDFLAVDGVERLLGGDANDQLNIDESEVLKDNYFDGDDEIQLEDDEDDETTDDPDMDGDSIVYDHTDMDNDGVADDDGDIDNGLNAGVIEDNDFVDSEAVSMRPSVEIVVESGEDTDLVNMTAGTIVGSDTTVDTLVDVETVDIADAAISATLDDILNVSNVDDGAYVDFTDGQVRDDNDDVLIRITGMTEMEVTEGSEDDDTVEVANDMTNFRAFDMTDVDTAISYASFLDYDSFEDTDNDGIDDTRVAFKDLDNDDKSEANNQNLFEYDLAGGQDRVDYSMEEGAIASVVDLDEGVVAQTVFVDEDGDDLFDDVGDNDADRIDLLKNVEQVVASQGESILDFTGADTNLSISYMSAADATVVAGDVREHIISIEDLDSSVPFSDISYVEYMDAGEDDDIAVPDALWNRIEGSDNDEKVELTDDQSAAVHTFNLRGGDNEVNYNELTRGINLSVQSLADGVTSLNIQAKDTDGTIFNDGDVNGNGVVDPGETWTDYDRITSYNSQNTVTVGSLRVEASQSEDDSIDLQSVNENNLVLLGQKEGQSDILTVTFNDGVADEEVNLVLTGFESLIDGAGDDVYVIDDLSDFVNTLTLIDNPIDDRDTLKLTDDAFENTPVINITQDLHMGDGDVDDVEAPGTLSEAGFDFDVLDISEVENQSNITATGDAAEDDNEIIVGDLDDIDTITNFDILSLSEATEQTTLDFDLDADELQDASNATLVEFDADTQVLDASRMSTADNPRELNIEVTDEAAVGAFVIGSTADDVITGGAGDDLIQGNGGDDTLNGGGDEVLNTITVELGIDPAGAAAPKTLEIDGAVVYTTVAGDGANTIGQEIVAYFDANPAATVAGQVPVGVSYSDGVLTFEFDVDSTVVDEAAINAALVSNDPNVNFQNSIQESDYFEAGAGDDVIYGGAGADTVDGGAGDDAFVVIGEVDEADYVDADVVGKNAEDFDDAVAAIVDGQATSDVSTDTFIGGDGVDTLEIWGAADFTDATIGADVEIIDVNSTVTFTADQLDDMIWLSLSAGSRIIVTDENGNELTPAAQLAAIQTVSVVTADGPILIGSAAVEGADETPVAEVETDLAVDGIRITGDQAANDGTAAALALAGAGAATNVVITSDASLTAEQLAELGAFNVTAAPGVEIIVTDGITVAEADALLGVDPAAVFHLRDTVANLAAAGATGDAAVDITVDGDPATTIIDAEDATVDQANAILAFTNTGTTSALTVEDLAANIEALTPAELADAGFASFDAEPVDALTFTVDQMLAVDGKIIDGDDVVTVDDDDANIEANAADLAAATNIDQIDVTDDTIALTAASAVTLDGLLVAGDDITVDDDDANIEANAADLAAATNIDQIDVTDDTIALTAASAVTLDGLLVAGDAITVADSGANIALQAGADLGSAKIDFLNADDDSVTLAEADAVAFVDALGTAVFDASDDMTVVVDSTQTALDLDALAAGAVTLDNADIDGNGDANVDTITNFLSLTDTIQLSAADLNALTGDATFVDGDDFGVDAGAYSAFVTGDGDVAATGTDGTIIYDADNQELLFDASGDTLFVDGVGITDTSGDDVIIAGIETVVAADIIIGA